MGLISDIEKEKENLLKKFDERKEKKIKEREYDEAFEELIDKEREEKKKKEADMFDFSFIELMGYSDDEEKDFNDELNEETLQFALKYIVKCKGTYNLGNFKLISDIEKEKENLLKKFDERKEKKIKEREYDEAFEELIDKEREEKKKKEADMFD